MEYKELFHPKFKQDLKRIDKLVVKEINIFRYNFKKSIYCKPFKRKAI